MLKGSLSSEPPQFRWRFHLDQHLKLFLSNLVCLCSQYYLMLAKPWRFMHFIIHSKGYLLWKKAIMLSSSYSELLLLLSFPSGWDQKESRNARSSRSVIAFAPRCILVGEMGIYTGGLPSAFSQFYFLAAKRMEFLKRRCTFLKQVIDKNKDAFLGYKK